MDAAHRLEFLRKLQRLLDEGDFAATYKFALLRALADLSVELGPDNNGGRTLSVGQLAEKFIEYYWRQARPYRDQILRQNTDGQAVVVSAIAAAHGRASSPAGLRADPRAWSALYRKVATNIELYPLRRLQKFPAGVVDFLYPQPPPRPVGIRPADFTIRLRPGVIDALREFHPFVVSMVETAWIRQITAIRANHDQLGAAGDLGQFLFGSERAALGDFAAVLRELYGSRCFYCDASLRGAGHVDHFIPRVRYQADLGHNFVLACPACNQTKRDCLAGMGYLRRWWSRNQQFGSSLGAELTRRRLPHDAARTTRVAAWAYEQAELAEASTWEGGPKFARLDTGWREIMQMPRGFPRAADEPRRPDDPRGNC
jgi:hypothetical protein